MTALGTSHPEKNQSDIKKERKTKAGFLILKYCYTMSQKDQHFDKNELPTNIYTYMFDTVMVGS